jgi:5-methylcytosine-specific restriction endonuclease McrA
MAEDGTPTGQLRLFQLPELAGCRYLRGAEWQRLRFEALELADYKCQLCGRQNRVLDVHHNTYRRVGRERVSDLVVLCRDCHYRYHEATREVA